MELWIRSQDKLLLEKVQTLKVAKYKNESFNELDFTFGIVVNNDYVFGDYVTKERAIEVLDEIQNKLNEQKNSYEDLVNKLKIFSETPIIKCDNNDNCNISLNIAMLKDMIIYEMPKD